MRVALAIPGLPAETVELELLRAGHTVVWIENTHAGLLDRILQDAPDVLLVSDDAVVATPETVRSCDSRGVRICLVRGDAAESATARLLGVHDVLRLLPGQAIDLRVLTAETETEPETETGGPPPVMPPATSPPPSSPWYRRRPARPPSRRHRAAPVTDAPARSGVHPLLAATPAAEAGAAPVVDAPPTVAVATVPRQRVIAVWGPAGAPGRTTIAITLAAELASRGNRVCLVDADTYGGTVAPALGLLDEAPGFAAACRLAGSDSLDDHELERISLTYGGTASPFRVLTGIGRPHRWPELSRDRVTRALEAARTWSDVVVVDTGFNLETDEEVSSDLLAPRRNAATIAALRAADEVVVVGAADPVGLTRLLRTHADLLETVTTDRVHVVVNRVRASVLGIDPQAQVRQTLERFGGVADPVLIPDDPAAADAALLSARTILDVAPRSSIRASIAALADRAGFMLEPTRRRRAARASRRRSPAPTRRERLPRTG
jgi:MinD-like ATPase involved in chromosome partitioning or flagellar assembly